VIKKLGLLIAVLFSISSTMALANVSVKGYTKKNGTYVMPHYRSNPDKKIQNNWSTKGNINPYTSKKGTKKIKNYGY
jgi:hypothetical protein